MFFEILLFAFLAIVIGLAFTFIGYRFFKFLLPIWAFFVGISTGMTAMDNLFNSTFLGVSSGLILGLILGIVFALLAYFVYALAIVLFGGYLGYMLLQGLFLMIGWESGLIPFMVSIGAGVVLALLFAKWSVPRLVIVIGTALGGSMTIISGVLALFGKVNPDYSVLAQTNAVMDQSWFWPLVWLVVAGFGIAVQYAMEKEIDMMDPYVIETVSVKSDDS